jgi:hypothetical protein
MPNEVSYYLVLVAIPGSRQEAPAGRLANGQAARLLP